MTTRKRTMNRQPAQKSLNRIEFDILHAQARQKQIRLKYQIDKPDNTGLIKSVRLKIIQTRLKYRFGIQ